MTDYRTTIRTPGADAITGTATFPDRETKRAWLEVQRADGADAAAVPLSLPHPQLFIADMDATMIIGECIDEMADAFGLGEEISAITQKAMAGGMDFREALQARVGMLKGLSRAQVDAVARNVQLQPGAQELLHALKAQGIRCVLVSGGFTVIADHIGALLGFDRVVANELEFGGDALTGRVHEPLVDKYTKLDVLNAECAALGITPQAAISIGDGANDLAMLEAAGYGIAFEGKPLLREAIDPQINVTDLTTVLDFTVLR